MIEITAAVPIIIAKAVKNDLILFDLIEEEADFNASLNKDIFDLKDLKNIKYFSINF